MKYCDNKNLYIYGTSNVSMFTFKFSRAIISLEYMDKVVPKLQFGYTTDTPLPITIG